MEFSSEPRLSRPPNLSEQVAHFLIEEIENGTLRPGDSLPPEAELASRFDVSRTIIREALVRLEFDGYISSRRGAKKKVLEYARRNAFRIRKKRNQTQEDLKHLYEFRAIIEEAAASLAARRSSKHDIAKLEKCLEELDRAVRNKEDHLPANVEFHQLIAKASGNDYLTDFMQFLDDKIWEQIEGDKDQFNSVGMPFAVHKEHLQIFKAIKNSDYKLAKESIREHIKNAAMRRNIQLDPI
jgi:GntR family transcriptional regulator, transcriptional repressor for pyruvate dehydrogenase complex